MASNPFENIPLQQLTEAHLRTLEILKTREGQDIEFKREMPLDTQAQKKEFCKDLSAFANSGGGYLICGVDENNGTAKSVDGIALLPKQEEVIRQIATSGILPHLQTIELKTVPLANGKHVVVISVRPDGFLHQVKYDDNRFYKRVGTITIIMDPADIAAFHSSATATTREQEVADERQDFEDSVKGRAFNKLEYDSGVLSLAIIPYIGKQVLPIFEKARTLMTSLRPIYCSGWDMQYHQHSITTFGNRANAPGNYAVTELRQHGTILGANSFILSIADHLRLGVRNSDRGMIPSVAYEREIITSTHNYFNILQQLGSVPPWFVCLSLLNVRGYILAVAPVLTEPNGQQTYERDDLRAGIVKIDAVDKVATPAEVAATLRPAFDEIWRSFGYDCSKNYDSGGRWVGH